MVKRSKKLVLRRKASWLQGLRREAIWRIIQSHLEWPLMKSRKESSPQLRNFRIRTLAFIPQDQLDKDFNMKSPQKLRNQ